jgi:hypothetical protein
MIESLAVIFGLVVFLGILWHMDRRLIRAEMRVTTALGLVERLANQQLGLEPPPVRVDCRHIHH